ncbi:DUF559 domain-containing protein [Sphingomonas sp. LB-2]|uniref:endonuclease domain-containing protein n=1 Tax=Sphingomonas caeni TaxID=2984949 RepID=UPI00222E17FD|nr:DUF559 domain-containing protein [Sphingomonas caeni]MCW3847952.1 DUF559 domain-containing protein [Sphingomonas caeni]
MRLYKNQPSGTVAALRAARRNPTEAESRLLCALREALPDYKWRFQAPMGPFRVDILCFAERLVIEIDGATHADTQAYDESRTCFIESEGYRVLRFWNNDVMGNTEGVVATVANSLSHREREGARAAKARGKGEGEGDKGVRRRR